MPVTLNRYAYGGNNPITYWDPTGYCIEICDGRLDGRNSVYFGDNYVVAALIQDINRSHAGKFSFRDPLFGSSIGELNTVTDPADLKYSTLGYTATFSPVDDLPDFVVGLANATVVPATAGVQQVVAHPLQTMQGIAAVSCSTCQQEQAAVAQAMWDDFTIQHEQGGFDQSAGYIGGTILTFIGGARTTSVASTTSAARAARHLDDIPTGTASASQRLALDTSRLAPRGAGSFPSTADEMTELLGVDGVRTQTIQGTDRTRWFPNDRTRITMESHPDGLVLGDPAWNPRHHGPHFHIQIRPDATTGWNNPAVIKVRPDGYTPGSGTGFVPGEVFPR